MKTADRASLARMVIGPDRREKLIQRYADGLVLKYGMRPDAAYRYATPFVDDADPCTVLAVGQVWSRPDGKEMPGDVLRDLTGREHTETFTVRGFSADGMVEVDHNAFMAADLFRGLWLTSWPEEFALDDEPQPPAEPIPAPADDHGASDEADEFDPRCVWFLVRRRRDDSLPIGEGLPLLGEHYRAVNWHKPEYAPSYGNALDVIAYLVEHLADYRAGWPDFLATYRGIDRTEGWIGFFNELDGGCECDGAVAAYLGHWLWQRVRSDVVREYGGKVNDYDVVHMWSPGKADVVIEAAPYADPEWEIPPDHPLVQCHGQSSLFDGAVS